MDQRKKILVVDDDPNIRSVIQDVLEENGYEAVHAGSGEEAVSIIKEVYLDLVIIDVVLPGIDGWQVCKMIKGDISLTHLPVIMLTANATGSLNILSYENKADACLMKPFSNYDLSSTVNKFIARR